MTQTRMGEVEEGSREAWCLPMRALVEGCRSIPPRPGVYVFRDGAGTALYVGTSGNLQARLRSYFQPAARRLRKERSILTSAVEVELRPAGSAFAASLEEARLIQAFAPPLNRRLKRPERYVYLRLDPGGGFPRLEIAAEADSGRCRHLGPFLPRPGLARALAVVNDAFGLRTCDGELTPDPDSCACWRADVKKCVAPCRGGVASGEYGRSVLRALNAIADGGRRSLMSLVHERDEHAAAERFEAAARVQRQLQAIDRLRAALRPVSLAQDWDHVLVVQPGSSARRVALWAVVGGRVVGHGEAQVDRLAEIFARVWARAQCGSVEAPEKEDLDVLRIVHRWVRRPQNRLWVIDLRTHGRTAAWGRVNSLVARMPVELFPRA